MLKYNITLYIYTICTLLYIIYISVCQKIKLLIEKCKWFNISSSYKLKLVRKLILFFQKASVKELKLLPHKKLFHQKLLSAILCRTKQSLTEKENQKVNREEGNKRKEKNATTIWLTYFNFQQF